MASKVKKDFYNNSNVRYITDNERLWKTAKLFFANKIDGHEKIIVLDEEQVILEENEVTETSKSYFETVVGTVGIDSK